MAIDEYTLQHWQCQSEARAAVVRVLRQAGVAINYIQETADDRSWGLMVQLPSDIARTFGALREVLLWGTLHPVADARGITQAVERLQENSIRLTQDLLLIITLNSGADATLEDAAGTLNKRVATLSLSQLQPGSTVCVSDVM